MVGSIILFLIIFGIGFMYSSSYTNSKINQCHPLTDELEREMEKRLNDHNRYFR